MADWTHEVVTWAGDTPVLIGVPAYDDADSGYHHPRVENPAHAIAGIHSGLLRQPELSLNYLGIAIYSDWEMTDDEWNLIRKEFSKRKAP